MDRWREGIASLYYAFGAWSVLWWVELNQETINAKPVARRVDDGGQI